MTLTFGHLHLFPKAMQEKYRNWKQEQSQLSNSIDAESKEFGEDVTRSVW